MDAVSKMMLTGQPDREQQQQQQQQQHETKAAASGVEEAQNALSRFIWHF